MGARPPLVTLLLLASAAFLLHWNLNLVKQAALSLEAELGFNKEPAKVPMPKPEKQGAGESAVHTVPSAQCHSTWSTPSCHSNRRFPRHRYSVLLGK